jgi:hypothetical protein
MRTKDLTGFIVAAVYRSSGNETSSGRLELRGNLSGLDESKSKDLSGFTVAAVNRSSGNETISGRFELRGNLTGLGQGESKRRLELSKRAVEVSIESGESAGMKVLEG